MLFICAAVYRRVFEIVLQTLIFQDQGSFPHALKLVTPNFFAFLTQVTHYLTAVNILINSID